MQQDHASCHRNLDMWLFAENLVDIKLHKCTLGTLQIDDIEYNRVLRYDAFVIPL